MAYNPSIHTTSNKPYGTQGTPVDARSWFYDDTTFSYRPYNSVNEVLNYLNTSNFRKGNFSIYIQEGADLKEYWFKDGIANSNLVEKVADLRGFPDDIDFPDFI